MKPFSSSRMEKTLLSAASAALLLAAIPAAAQVKAPGNATPLPASAQKAPPFQQGGGGGGFEALLQGDYIYSGAASCVNSSAGFFDDFRPRIPPGQPGNFVNAFSVNGIRTFDGQGGGTMNGRTLGIGAGGAGTNTFAGTFSYAMDGDLNITITSNSAAVTLPDGTEQVLVGAIVMKGRITEDLGTIHVMQVEPFVERIETPDGTVLNQRICYRDRTLVRLKRSQ